MKIYLLTAAGVIFLSIIVSLVIPEGKLNKTIVFVMRMAASKSVCVGLFSFVYYKYGADEYNDKQNYYDYFFISFHVINNADNIMTRSNILNAVSTALHIDKKIIAIYSMTV